MSYLMILNRLGQSTGHKEAVGMPTLHIGSRISEELIPKVKGCTFIVMGDNLKSDMRHQSFFTISLELHRILPAQNTNFIEES